MKFLILLKHLGGVKPPHTSIIPNPSETPSPEAHRSYMYFSFNTSSSSETYNNNNKRSLINIHNPINTTNIIYTMEDIKIPKEIEDKVEVFGETIKIKSEVSVNEVADIFEKLLFGDKYVYINFTTVSEKEIVDELESIKDAPQFKSAVLEKGDIVVIWERYLDIGDIRYIQFCFKDRDERDKYACISFMLKKARK